MGTTDAVILNDIEAMRDAFSKDTILDRPPHGVAEITFGTKSFGDDSGRVWQEHRRLSLHVLKDLGFGKTSMDDRVIEEFSYLIERIDKTEGKPLSIHRLLFLSVSNNVAQFIYGHRFELDDQKFINMSKCYENALGLMCQTSLLNNIPFWISRLIVKIVMIGYGRTLRKMLNIFE